jgi:hypothetical protein
VTEATDEICQAGAAHCDSYHGPSGYENTVKRMRRVQRSAPTKPPESLVSAFPRFRSIIVDYWLTPMTFPVAQRKTSGGPHADFYTLDSFKHVVNLSRCMSPALPQCLATSCSRPP